MQIQEVALLHNIIVELIMQVAKINKNVDF